MLIVSGCVVKDSQRSSFIPVLDNRTPWRETKKKFKFYIWEENPRELFHGKPTRSSRD